MFEVTARPCKLTKMLYRKPRKQSGNVRETEIDLIVTMTIPNTDLAMFGPNWLDALFDYDPEEKQGRMDSAPTKTKLRLPEQEDIKLMVTFLNIDATLDHGLTNKLIFQDAKTRDFVLRPKDGGSVDVRFKLTCRPTSKQLADLDPLIMGGETPLTLAHSPRQADLVEAK